MVSNMYQFLQLEITTENDASGVFIQGLKNTWYTHVGMQYMIILLI